MNGFSKLLTAGLLVAAAPVAAQSIGMNVTDGSGAPVGTVIGISGDNLLVKTDKHQALLPKSGFTAADGKLMLGMTRAELNAQIEQSAAAAQSAIVAGAAVQSSDGARLGTIDSLAEGKAVIRLDDGGKVAVPQEGVRGNADGTVTVGYSAAQLKALGGAEADGSAGAD